MSESMITRCPKCSTTFRVTQEVLNMAKGKVRCGQCFHIFAAEPDTRVTPSQNSAKPSPPPAKPSQTAAKPSQEAVKPAKAQPKSTPNNVSAPQNDTGTKAPMPTANEEDVVNPEWLNTLFDEEDLEPYSPESESGKTDKAKSSAGKTESDKAPTRPTARTSTPAQQSNEDLAPWEMELAQIEEQFSATVEHKEPIFSEKLTPQTTAQSKPANSKEESTKPETRQRATEEPDYMQALHSLAQDISKQDTLSANEYASQESVKQLAAEYSLASLTGSNQAAKPKSKFKWLWTTGTLVALIVLAIQVGTGYFEQGSRSPEFRSFYKVACTYLGCTLPTFEDIKAIEIEHVRIQSHPTQTNTLLVNAIMTNTSRYAQPMPKLALEFYDLNGNPVAARLFAPKDYLHRDFLDITYMPPNTPIHIVIPIQDPGARAVTHQIKVFASNTRSY